MITLLLLQCNRSSTVVLETAQSAIFLRFLPSDHRRRARTGRHDPSLFTALHQQPWPWRRTHCGDPYLGRARSARLPRNDRVVAPRNPRALHFAPAGRAQDVTREPG